MSPVWYYAYFLIFATVALLVLGIIAMSRWRSIVSFYFMLTVSACAVYAFGYAMEVTQSLPEAILFWSRFEYLGMPFISSFLLLFVVHFVAGGRRVPVVVVFLPLAVSCAILVIRQTTGAHGLYYAAVDFVQYRNFVALRFEKGAWYWIFAAYNGLCMVSSGFLVLQFMLRASKAFRRQASLLFVGIIFPVFPYLFWVSRSVPHDIDIIPASLAVAAAAFYVALFRHDLFSLVPVGRDRLVETMADAVFVLDGMNRVADANPAALAAFGAAGADPVGTELSEAFPVFGGTMENGCRAQAEGRTWQCTVTELSVRRGRFEGFLVVARDVTEHDALVSGLEKAAREDALTEVLNRHSWDEEVKRELLQLSRHGRFGSVVYLDLDHFKSVNDDHGHAAGDAVLRSVAGVLKNGVRRPDLVGRYGGEEFVLFLPESTPDDAADVAERLRVDLQDGLAADKTVVQSVTGSFGVAGGLILEDTTLEQLISRADAAMYESKKLGRNRVTQADADR